MLNPSYKLPSRKTISSNLLPLAYNKILEKVKSEISNVTAVSVTTDAWTSLSNDSYLAITVDFLKDIDNDCEMKSFLLDCFQFSERHTAENLAKEIKRVLSEWSLEKNISAVVTDNAANVKAAIRICGWNITCAVLCAYTQFNCSVFTERNRAASHESKENCYIF